MSLAADHALPVRPPNGDSSARPLGKGERLVTLDVLRGFALLGILVLNIDEFYGPISVHDIPLGVAKPAFVAWHAQLDQVILTIKWLFFEGKMRAMFAVLFGAGCLLLTERIERQGDPGRAADIFTRRNMWLMLFGLIHGSLIWGGDILLSYSISALLFLYPLRRLPARRLIVVGAFTTLVLGSIGISNFIGTPALLRADGLARQAVLAQAEGRVPTAEQQGALDAAIKAEHEEPAKIANAIKESRRPYLQWVIPHAEEFSVSIAFQVRSLLFMETVGLMILGMGLFKCGFLTGKLSTRTYLLTALISYGISMPIVLIGIAHLAHEGFSAAAAVRWMYLPYDFQVLPAMLGNASVILLILRFGWFKTLTRNLANVGRTAFSNYIMTSLICQTLFLWGPWKLFGTLEYYQQIFVIVPVWMLNFAASALWLRFFAYGPLEWVWRSLTYWQRQPLVLRPQNAGRLAPLTS